MAKRVYSDDGSLQFCTGECGRWLPLDCFYEGRSVCADCFSKERAAYQRNSLEARLGAAYRAQEKRAGELTWEDNLTVEQLEFKLEQQGYSCTCGKPFESISDFEIAHITPPSKNPDEECGHLTYRNIDLVCHEHNARGIRGRKKVMYFCTEPVVAERRKKGFLGLFGG